MNEARHIDIDTLNALIDDAVPEADRAGLMRHLAGCPACQRELNELRAVATLYAALPQFMPPRLFTLGPEYHRPRAVPRAIHLLPVLRPLSIAAVLVFVLLSAFAVANTQQGSASSSDQAAPAPQQRAAVTVSAPPSAAAAPATQPALNAAQGVAPAGGSEGVRAARTTNPASKHQERTDRTLSGWWIASFIVGLGMALLLLAWFALDRRGAHRFVRA